MMKYQCSHQTNDIEFDPLTHGEVAESPEDQVILMDTINHLSENAKTIIKIIFASPPPPGLVEEVSKRRGLNKWSIVMYLWRYLHWKENTIKVAMRELKETFSQ